MSLKVENQRLFDEVVRDRRITEAEMRRLENKMNQPQTIQYLFSEAAVAVVQSDIDLYRKIEGVVLGNGNVVVEPGAFSYFQNHFKETRRVLAENKKDGLMDTAWWTGFLLLGGSLIVFPEPGSSIAGVGIALVASAALLADGIYSWATGNCSFSIFSPSYYRNF